MIIVPLAIALVVIAALVRTDVYPDGYLDDLEKKYPSTGKGVH